VWAAEAGTKESVSWSESASLSPGSRSPKDEACLSVGSEKRISLVLEKQPQ
jgi:hypothetical protein